MKTSIRSHIEANIWKTYLIMAVFSVFVVLLAYVFGQALGLGSSWLWIGLFFAFISNFVSYYWGDKIVLSMSGARPADRKREFDFFTVAENISIAAGIPKPKLYVIDDTAMNAFATGRDPKHAVVCATTGLLSRLERSELEGVVAHEIAHIKNYDIRLMLIVSVLVGTVAFLADTFLHSLWWGGGDNRRDDNRGGNGLLLLIGIVLAILAPFAAMLIQLAISRRREFLADASAAYLTRNPDGLARALAKLGSDREVLEAATNATAHLYITNPFKGKDFQAWFANLFNTHPPIEERIRRLRSM
ncbi:MAG: M48 family metallopeptidase [Patescibacteria group bacterium]|nr:M48 family metallopeptidase [Patescibacteria group bacterium]